MISESEFKGAMDYPESLACNAFQIMLTYLKDFGTAFKKKYYESQFISENKYHCTPSRVAIDQKGIPAFA